ncbi:MAG: TetR/AcrR family transcriptional regulator [Deltaproteobacteria bacterium]|jgi:TetR/AcrR family transcriptional regulator, fatty acid metabolism regulator protein|nr:TetR/AcrR family transcriptional regulator [Deltaproteobacteria bacterium]
MGNATIPATTMDNDEKQGSPPAMLKLAAAMRRLLRTKDFNSITTAEISRTAGANEALIYRYFKDKRGLLHQVLYDYLLDFHTEVQNEINAVPDALGKLKCLIRTHIRMYDSNRVFARILLLEVRNFPAYFESTTYRLVKGYGKMVSDIIVDGVAAGEIRDDVPVSRIRDLILGGIEHFCIAEVIFNHKLAVDETAGHLCELLFSGIKAESVAGGKDPAAAAGF